MSARRVVKSTPAVALFDLDGTLTWHDTLLPFLWGFVARRAARLARLWRIAPAIVEYSRDRDRGNLKSRVIRAAMGKARRSEVDAYANAFVARLEPRGMFRAAALATLEAHRAAGDRLVLLSASPDLYVPRIGKLLGFEQTICTEVLWDGDELDGALVSANRRGIEKSRCLERLRAEYAELPIVAYGNSESDLDHMRRADRAVLVNANARARRRAADSGIPIADWK
jgi:phosphatidylglycerophosphatase C